MMRNPRSRPKVAIVVAFFTILCLAFTHAQAINACAQGCVQNIYGNPTGLSCPGEDMECICNSGSDLTFAIRDCITQACDLTGDALTTQLSAATQNNAQTCAAYTSTSAATTATPAATPATTAVPTVEAATTAGVTTPGATTTTAETSITHGALTPITTALTAATPTDLAGVAVSTPVSDGSTTSATAASDASNEDSSAATGTSTATGTSATTATSTGASSTTSGADSSDPGPPPDGMSPAAKAGVGVGVGIAAIAAGLVALCSFLRNKKKNRDQANNVEKGLTSSPPRPPRGPGLMVISPPLPGSGRITGDEERHPLPVPYSPSASSSQPSPKSQYSPSTPSRDAQGNELGRARRYEDMLPRTQPRPMF